MDALQRADHKFDLELHNGDVINASINLQNEFENNPKEALSIIQREMQRESAPGNNDKSTIGIASNGDVFIYDQDHTGYYAGTVPQEMREQPPQTTSAAQASAPTDQTAGAPPAAASAAPSDQSFHPQDVPPPPSENAFHIPFPIQIGIHNDSLQLGVDIFGLADGGVTLGAQNRGYVGSDIAQTQVSAGVDINQDHIGPAADVNLLNGQLLNAHARVGLDPRPDGVTFGARVNADAIGQIVQVGGHAGAELGRRTGPAAGGYAYVGPVGADANGYANVSDQGFRAGAGGDVGAQPAIGLHAEARTALGAKNEAHVDADTNIGESGLRAGVGLYPQFQPGGYIQAYSGTDDSEGG
jgi:hypothetical protein